MNEQEFVARTFQESFKDYCKQPIVLYGLGKNTQAILENTQGYRFVGLMDSANEGKEVWGYPVLSKEQVVQLNAIIVIIARESVVPIIYKRIEDLHTKYGMAIYNYEGVLLGENADEYKNEDLPYWQMTETQIKSEIDVHEVISFDIFDTLIMRQILYPADIFLLMEQHEAIKSIKCDYPFSYMRREAEDTLDGYPTIHQIYENLAIRFSVTRETTEQWKAIEYAFEKELIVIRKRMVDIFEYTLGQGKQVFLLTDMYYSKEELSELLVSLGVKGFSDLIVSCDHHCGKEDGLLYEVLKEAVGHDNILHIGDNRISDGEHAKEHGIDSFLIYSGYDMWMASAMQNTLIDVKNLEKRCILGILIQELCNNPFVLHKGKGRFAVDNPSMLGFGFIAPLFGEFMSWLGKDMGDIDQLLLPVRDEKIALIWQSIERYITVYAKIRRILKNWNLQISEADEIFGLLFSDNVIVEGNIKEFIHHI